MRKLRASTEKEPFPSHVRLVVPPSRTSFVVDEEVEEEEEVDTVTFSISTVHMPPSASDTTPLVRTSMEPERIRPKACSAPSLKVMR